MPDSYPPPGKVVLGLIAAMSAASAPTLLLGPISLVALPIALIMATVHTVLLAAFGEVSAGPRSGSCR
jgi:hypothetical protein